MLSVTDNQRLEQFINDCRQQDKTIALVPTMGNLHDGHLALVAAARKNADVVITTIFVNPLQFGANEDLGRYPRTPEEDSHKLDEAGCDLLFMPAVELVYPDGIENQTVVKVPVLSSVLCGASRPGHFEGVATVVSKLFNLIRADQAYFGEKDYQQLQIIRKLTRDLCFPIQIIGVPTVRDVDGLALSSRNLYLNAEERPHAANLNRQLNSVARQIQSGNRDYRALERMAADSLDTGHMKPDYFAICEANSLAPATDRDEQLVILGAVWLGKTRLIDNIRINL